jgi:drug/metabolite transporter (DMT)-like permease
MKFKIFMWLFVLAWVWGPAFLFVKVAVEEIPPLTLVAIRVSIAAALLYVIMKVQGHNLPKFGSIWKHFIILGLINNAVPYVLLSWGEQYIDSALAAILIGTTPIFTMILAHLYTTTDHLSSAKVFGVALGFGGVVALVGPALVGGVQATILGLLASVAAAASYAAALVYAKNHMRGLPPLVAPTAQLTVAAIFLAPLALIADRPATLPLPSWSAAGSLLLLATISTALAFALYYRALESISATNLSMVTYLIPIVATILGVIILHEQLGWNIYLGSVLILSGVMAVNGILPLPNWRRSSRATVKPGTVSAPGK